MQTSTTIHITKDTRVTGYVLNVAGLGPTMYLQVGDGENSISFIMYKNTDFLDKLSNEAERLCREYVGDVPPLEPLSDDCPNCKRDECECTSVALHGGPEVA